MLIDETVKTKVAPQKQTIIEKYGVESYSQTEDFLNKCKNTNLDKLNLKI
jgi:hypothetical protein